MRGPGNSSWVRPVLIVALAAMFVVSFASAREAAALPMARTWTGNGADSNWMTAANWDSGLPVNNDTLVFPAVANRKANTNNFPANTFFFDIRFTGPGYTLGGNVLRVDGLVINDATTGANAINLSLIGAGGVDVTAGTLRMNGAHNYSGPTNVRSGAELVAAVDGSFGSAASGTTVAGGGTISLVDSVNILSEGLTIGGSPASVIRASGQSTWYGSIALAGVLTEFNLSGLLSVPGIISGPNTASLMKTGSGALVLRGANTYSGGTIVAGGLLRASRLGDSTLPTNVVSGASLVLDEESQVLTERIDIRGSGVGGRGALQASGVDVSVGNVFLGGPSTIGTPFLDASFVLPNGLKQSDPSAALTKAGLGTVFLNGAGDFLGPITVAEGTLSVNATLTNEVTVLADGLLRGTGSVDDLTVQGGQVRPGSLGPGVLAASDLVLNGQSRLIFDLDGTPAPQYSRLDVTGVVSLGGATLAIDLDFSPSVGDTFTIIQNAGADAVVGTFATLPDGATFTADGAIFTISYKSPSGTGNDVAIRVTGFASADLSVELSGAPSPAQAGALLTYVITARNAGPQGASNPTVMFGVPAKTTFESIKPNAGWSCTQPAVGGAGNVSCGAGTFPSGAVATFTHVVRVNNAATGTIAASAIVASDFADDHSSNNSAAATTTIGPTEPRPFKNRLLLVARDG